MKKIILLFLFMVVLCAGRAVAADLNLGVDYRAANGAERSADISTLGASLSATQALGDRYSLSMTGLGEHYGFSSHNGLFARGAGLSLDYHGLFSGAGVSYLSRSFDDGIPGRDDYSVYYWIQMLKNAGLRLSYGKTTRMTNFTALRSNIGDRYLSASVSYHLAPQVSLGVDFRKGDIDDGNTYSVQGFEAKAMLAQSPGKVYAKVRMERQMYDVTSTNYYSPADYKSYSGTLGYGRDFKVAGLQGLHCDVALKATGDSNSQFAVKPEASVNADITPSLALNVKYAQTYAPYLSDSATSVALTWKP